METIHPHVHVTRKQIEQFCRKWKIVRLELFGSVLREDFRPDSDIDVLVTFEDGVRYRIADLMNMDEDAKSLFSRDVDLVERRLVEQNPNWVRRNRILRTAQQVYAA
jgi:predicted nucleotidyltransferase